MVEIPPETNDWAYTLIQGMLIILKYQPHALPDYDTYPGTFIFGDFNVEMSEEDRNLLYKLDWSEHEDDDEVYWRHY